MNAEEIDNIKMGDVTDSEGACVILAKRFGREVYGIDNLHQLVKRGKLRAFVFQSGRLVERHLEVSTRGRDLIFLKTDLESLPVPKVGKPAGIARRVEA